MIEFKSISSTPNETLCNSHYYCDYIELLALVDCDDGVNFNDVYDRFLEDEKITDIGTENNGHTSEVWNSRINNWFSEISSRAMHYGDYYPFLFDGVRVKRKDDILDIHHVYICLLLSSLLKYVDGYHQITTIFEKLSYYALKKYLPNDAEVHLFGVSSDRSSKYTGSLERKFTLLASDLGLNRSTRANIFKPGDNGDGGIDIIAWIPFRNDLNSERKQIFLGQSASGKNWSNKQASVDRVKNFLADLPDNAQNMLFVPFDFRDADRNFCQNDEITASLIFDRHRIIMLVDVNDMVSDILSANFQEIIAYALDFEEDIV
ncbi:hypothetical protein ACTBCG_002542 [Providencia rettgeri]|uniref:hypothetical protein n=1 Tax=Providencia rettgeri TaxID=587 RepID=UPI0018C4BFE3|nr:hypothetical protein [Providencia rettgeri]MBG5899964.1 hypothetical protein [Providencia rettgeri]